MRASPRRRRRLVMQGNAVRHLAKQRFGVTSARAIGVHLGIDPATMARLLRGQNQPSGEVVAILIDGLDARFDQIFAVQADDLEPAADVA